MHTHTCYTHVHVCTDIIVYTCNYVHVHVLTTYTHVYVCILTIIMYIFMY